MSQLGNRNGHGSCVSCVGATLGEIPATERGNDESCISEAASESVSVVSPSPLPSGDPLPTATATDDTPFFRWVEIGEISLWARSRAGRRSGAGTGELTSELNL